MLTAASKAAVLLKKERREIDKAMVLVKFSRLASGNCSMAHLLHLGL
jgi:hypothetical protein